MPGPLAALPYALTGLGIEGAGAYSLFGNKKSSQDDPLAGIRQQLLALSGQVPEMVSRQKELIGERFKEAEQKGVESIGEDVYATRGFGKGTTIYDRLKTELIDKLARSRAEAELQAEFP